MGRREVLSSRMSLFLSAKKASLPAGGRLCAARDHSEFSRLERDIPRERNLKRSSDRQPRRRRRVGAFPLLQRLRRLRSSREIPSDSLSKRLIRPVERVAASSRQNKSQIVKAEDVRRNRRSSRADHREFGPNFRVAADDLCRTLPTDPRGRIAREVLLLPVRSAEGANRPLRVLYRFLERRRLDRENPLTEKTNGVRDLNHRLAGRRSPVNECLHSQRLDCRHLLINSAVSAFRV